MYIYRNTHLNLCVCLWVCVRMCRFKISAAEQETLVKCDQMFIFQPDSFWDSDSSVLQCLYPIAQKSQQQQIWRYHMNLLANNVYIYILRKFDLSNKIKSYMGTTLVCFMQFWTNPGSSTPQNSTCTATYLPSQKPSKWVEQEMRVTAGEMRMNSWQTFFDEPLHMDVPMLADQQKLIYISSLLILDVFWKTCRMQWMIGTDAERKSRKSMLSTWLDDNDIDIKVLMFLYLLYHKSIGHFFNAKTFLQLHIAQSGGAVEYSDSISAEGVSPPIPQRVSKIWH